MFSANFAQIDLIHQIKGGFIKNIQVHARISVSSIPFVYRLGFYYTFFPSPFFLSAFLRVIYLILSHEKAFLVGDFYLPQLTPFIIPVTQILQHRSGLISCRASGFAVPENT